MEEHSAGRSGEKNSGGTGSCGMGGFLLCLPFLALTDRYAVILKELVHFEQLPPR